jgi:hypothetical protein
MGPSFDDAMTALHSAAIVAARAASKADDPRAARLREIAGETGDMLDGFNRPAPVFKSRRVPPPLPRDPHLAMGEVLRRARAL